MTKDFIIGFLLGVIIVLLLTRWEPDDDDTPDDSARQGIPNKQPLEADFREAAGL